MDLDQMLAEATPPAARTRETDLALRSMVDEARAASRPRRRHRWLIAAAVVPIAIGGTAAAARVVPASWIPWTTPDGSACQMEFMVDAAGPDGEPNMMPRPIDREHQAKLLADARAYLGGLDVTSIDQEAAIDAWEAEQRKIEAQGLEGDHIAGDELAITAVGREVWRRLDAHLADLGYDMRVTKGSDLFLLVGSQAWRCGK